MNQHFIETDILVVGHGISGLSAAITAKEEAPDVDVLTVDKACVGYAGKANKGGGHVAYIPEGGEEQYVEYHTRNLGDYLNDQDMLRKYAKNTIKTMDRWESWGVKIMHRDSQQNAHPVIPWRICLVDLDMMIHMGKHAKKLGVRSMEKISVTELIKDGNRVTGAMGIDLISGDLIVFKAKAVIMANGNQNFKVMRMWNSSRGDGIAAAYRAGAKIRNAEFGSFMNILNMSSKTVAYGAEDVLVNSQGELCTEREGLDESLKSVVGGVDLGGFQAILMYFDVRDGKGPIYEDVEKNEFIGSFIGRNMCCYGGDADPPFYRPVAQKFWNTLYNKNRLGSFSLENNLREVIPGVIGEQSPLAVDHDMATSLDGMFASGDICANGSSWSGAVPTPPGRNRGSGLMHAVFTGIIAGTSASKFAGENDFGNIDPAQIEKVEKKVARLLNKTDGIDPEQIIWEIKNLIQPVEYTGYKSEERLREGLDRVLALKEKLTELKAKDPHGVSAANECESIVLGAEMFFRASLERKETRGWHIREDFKERDDENHLNWIVLQNNEGSMSVSREDIPIEQYRYKP